MMNKPRLRPIMFAGTGSDVGKSVIAAGFCRIFLQDGYSPAPFKAQNMALNSYATPDGLEIGRAQAVQAEAAGIPCSTDMNPLLLKPSSDHTSQIVLHGKPVGQREAYTYYQKEVNEPLRAEIHKSFDRLRAMYNPIVMEGAGSVAELNLRDTDLVNMAMARHADAAVILVADIERGGVFASAYGSIMLQQVADRARIKGILVNKFRGDIRLFEKGRTILEQICQVPVLGVVPYIDHLQIEEEDSMSLRTKSQHARPGCVNIAVVRLPHLSNYTDFDRLEYEPDVHLYYTASPVELSKADLVILPGSKNTLSDLQWLRNARLDTAIAQAYAAGRTVVGICGGYQMLGVRIDDPYHVESELGSMRGLGLLPVTTVLSKTKVTRRVKFRMDGSDIWCEGYEIHMGETTLTDGAKVVPLATLQSGSTDGYAMGAKCWGTYLHGIFDNDVAVQRLLAPFGHRVAATGTRSREAIREAAYDRLADHLRQHVDVAQVYKILSHHD